MVKIRLARGGAKKKPFYHIVAADIRSRRDGRSIERLGFFNPVARGKEETLRLVNELRKQVEECGFHYHGKAVTITVSCGVSSFRENDTLEQVFERADKALYKAKKNGRNQCVIASVRSD